MFYVSIIKNKQNKVAKFSSLQKALKFVNAFFPKEFDPKTDYYEINDDFENMPASTISWFGDSGYLGRMAQAGKATEKRLLTKSKGALNDKLSAFANNEIVEQQQEELYAISVGCSYTYYDRWSSNRLVKKAKRYIGTFKELLKIFKPILDDADKYQKEHPEVDVFKRSRSYREASGYVSVPTVKINVNPKNIDELILQLKRCIKNEIHKLSEANSSIKLTAIIPMTDELQQYYEEHGAGEVK